MARSRLRSKRAKFKRSNAKHIGWSKTKSIAIVVILAVFAALILFIVIALFVLR